MINTLQKLERIKSKTKNYFVQYINNIENQENLLNSYGKNRENNTKKKKILSVKKKQNIILFSV